MLQKMQRYNRIQFIFVQVLLTCSLFICYMGTKYFKVPASFAIYILFAWLAMFVTINIITIVKRLHDMGLSGYWVIAVTLLSEFSRIFPDNVGVCVDTALIVFFALMPGDKVENKYGLASEKRLALR